MDRPRKVIVISDLHLAGDAKMMSRPSVLATFIDGLKAGPREDLELVVAGDFVDYFALQPVSAWTQDPQQAIDKLAFLTQPRHQELTAALCAFVARGHALTILVGNHDVELALPGVQDHLRTLFKARPNQLRFIDDGSAHTIGRLLIEHGNRYDDSNITDWNAIRAIRSTQSRHEAGAHLVCTVPAGSLLVEKILNPLKLQGYGFLDLIKPQNELLALLMLAFEPELRWSWSALARVFRTNRAQAANVDGHAPARIRNVGLSEIDDPTAWRAELEGEFGDACRELLGSTARSVGVGDWMSLALTPQENGVRSILERGEPIPAEQRRRIRAVMRPLIQPDSTDTAQYGRAAKRLNAAGFQTVIMGHTHLPREVIDASNEVASYINCGTWIDSIEVPPHVLEEPAGEDPLDGWLRSLLRDTAHRNFQPTWAEALVAPEGKVESARLRGAGR
jgi:UDP-2,3-diacylglucosamine pyrophosphatase LpxH